MQKVYKTFTILSILGVLSGGMLKNTQVPQWQHSCCAVWVGVGVQTVGEISQAHGAT